MSNKMLPSKFNKTEMLFSKIDEARELAKRLESLSEAVESATQKRDAALYQFFAKLHYLKKRFRRLNPPKIELEEKYGRLPRSAIAAVLKMAYRGLNSKQQSKYAALLRYVGAKKQREESVKSLIRRTGGINRCIEEEKKLRNKRARGWGAKR